MKSDKRRVQRIVLDPPIEAVLAKQEVRIIDLSTTGARIEHPRPLGGRREATLCFEAGEEKVSLSCELVRSRLQRSAYDPTSIVYSSGLRYSDPSERARGSIRQFVARLVERPTFEIERHADAEDSVSMAV